MTIIEIYCDRCDMPAPDYARMVGAHVGQRIRQEHPLLRCRLRGHRWVFTHEARDLCPECAFIENAKDKPPLPNAAAHFRRPRYRGSSGLAEAIPVVEPAASPGPSNGYAAAVADFRKWAFRNTAANTEVEGHDADAE